MNCRVLATATLRVILGMILGSIASSGQPGSSGDAPLYNTAKQKLLEGKQIVGGTVSTTDPDVYCAMANAGFDFLWIEMQHSPLSFQDVARMIWACRGRFEISVS